MGNVTLYTGPMFSGKTESIIKNVVEIESKGDVTCQCFKPSIDNRFHEAEIRSHSGFAIHATSVSNATQIKEMVNPSTKTIIIDEVQFFDQEIITTIKYLKNKNKEIYISGLNLDYKQEPFKITKEVSEIADKIHEMTSSCHVCHAPAQYTYRKPGKGNDLVLIGGNELYEARCQSCYEAGNN